MKKSEAQKFAQKRNSAGGLMKGMIINLEQHILPFTSSSEKMFINGILKDLKKAHGNWSDNYEQAKEEKV